MAKRAAKKKTKSSDTPEESSRPAGRSIWSGTVTFGLVSIPVELYSVIRPRRKAMKLVDTEGNALGRRYRSSTTGKDLAQDDLVRGFETDSGDIVVITDEEFEAVAPEMSRDIDMRMFVQKEQIPAVYYERPYFLAPSGKSAKAYHLLANVMERTGRVGIGAFVMRGHEYLVAIVAENGVLRAATLRYADEIRTPKYVGLPAKADAPAKRVTALAKAIDALTETKLDMSIFEDRQAAKLRELAEAKFKRGEDVVEQKGLEDEDSEYDSGSNVIDIMEALRKSLSKTATVTTAATARSSRRARRPQRAGALRKAS